MVICLDASCIISLIERTPIWSPKVVARLAQASAAGDTLAACDLARAECLVGPLQQGKTALAADFQRFFASGMVAMLPLAPEVCERAAAIRATSATQIKLPDALHLAAAAAHGCGLFLTSDVALGRTTVLPVEVLS